jgi:hypothetical protein
MKGKRMTKFNIGDTVKCIKDSFPKEFTLGKTYKVRECSGYGNNYRWNTVICDDGKERIVNSYSYEGVFELLTEEKKEEAMINYHVLTNSIVLNYHGKTVQISNDDGRYSAVISAIKAGKLDDIPSIVEIERKFNGNGVELLDGLLHVNGTPLPSELSNRILAYKEQGLPYDSLLKFWDNLKQNPSFNSRNQLFKFLYHNGHPLTPDGHFIAYRGVSEDFKDMHTGKFDNKVGSVCEVNRSEVDDNPNNTCSFGLHVACYNYAKDFGKKLIEVSVNPKDVVAVPTDYNGTKMRVSRFKVEKECVKELVDVQLYGFNRDVTDDCEYDYECTFCEGEEECNGNCDQE